MIIAAVNTAISIFFYLNMVRSAYGQDPDGRPDISLTLSGKLLNVGLILAIILLGTLPTWFFDLARTACKSLIS